MHARKQLQYWWVLLAGSGKEVRTCITLTSLLITVKACNITQTWSRENWSIYFTDLGDTRGPARMLSATAEPVNHELKGRTSCLRRMVYSTPLSLSTWSNQRAAKEKKEIGKTLMKSLRLFAISFTTSEIL